MEEGIKCPVCGKYTFEEYNDMDICDECWWLNDGIQMNNPDYKGGGNHMSLNEAKAAYAAGKKVR